MRNRKYTKYTTDEYLKVQWYSQYGNKDLNGGSSKFYAINIWAKEFELAINNILRIGQILPSFEVFCTKD